MKKVKRRRMKERIMKMNQIMIIIIKLTMKMVSRIKSRMI
jgi:hypothetical protein